MEDSQDSVPNADDLVAQIRKSREAFAASQKKPEPAAPVAGAVASSSVAPVIQTSSEAVKKINESIPDEARPYIEPLLGVGAGAIARKYVIPKNAQFNPDVDAQGMQQIDQAKTQLARNPIDLSSEQKLHADRAAQLTNEANAAHTTHGQISDQLTRAQQEHEFAKARDPIHELTRENIALRPAEIPVNAPVELTPRPTGGEATAKYAREFGASPMQALDAESMSKVQRGVIPANVSGAQLTSEIAPEFRAVNESPLMLERGGLEAVKERKFAENIAAKEIEKIKLQDEARLQQIRDEIAKHKAHSGAEVERIKLAEKHARDDLKEAKRAIAEHAKGTPLANLEKNRQAEDALKFAQKNVYKTKLNMLQPLARIGRLGGRFVPIAGAALAPEEFRLAQKDKEAGNMLRYYSHMLGGTGAALQATGWPPAMGAGDIMQLPSFGYAAYDTTKEMMGNGNEQQGALPVTPQSVIK